MKIKYNSYNEMPLRVYQRMISEIRDTTDEITRVAIMLAAATNSTTDDILNLPMESIERLAQGISWMANLNSSPDKSFKNITVGKFGECKVDVNMHNFTISQYIDFQTFVKTIETNPEQALAVFIIPKDHKYAEGYDQVEMMEEILDNVDIVTAKEIIAFFLKRFLRSIESIMTYSQMTTWMKMKTTLNKETKEELKNKLELIKAIKLTIGSVLSKG